MRFVIHFGERFAHGRALKLEAVGVVTDAVEDGVGERRLANDVMRGLGPLAVANGRAAAASRLDDFHQVTTLRGCQPVWRPVWRPVVEDQQLCLGDAAEQTLEAAACCPPGDCGAICRKGPWASCGSSKRHGIRC